MKIGVLGGTFDPIHNGHLEIAEAARTKLELAEVYFVPAGQTPMKEDSPILPAEHRVAMVRLAIEGKPYFKLSTIELERPGLSYTVETINELQERLGAENEIYFILGWDSLTQFPYWREPRRIIEVGRLVAIPRPGHILPDLKALEAAVPGISERLVILEEPLVDISATGIRRRVALGLPIDHLVPETVAEYIKKKGLYVN